MNCIHFENNHDYAPRRISSILMSITWGSRQISKLLEAFVERGARPSNFVNYLNLAWLEEPQTFLLFIAE